MVGPRRVAGGAVLDVRLGADDRLAAIVGALNVIAALSTCGESLATADGDREVLVSVSCGDADCPVCGIIRDA